MPQLLKSPSVLDMVRANLGKLDQLRADDLMQRAKAVTVSETIGLRTLAIDLGSAVGTTVPLIIDAEGYSVRIAKGGSDRFPVMMDLGSAGSYQPVYPGCTINPRQRFTKIRLRKWFSATVPVASASGFTGPGCYSYGRYLTLIIGKTKEAEFPEDSSDMGGFNQARDLFPTYNALTNIPTALSLVEGMSVRGARCVRTGVVASAGTILGGTIVWWADGGLGAWGETDLQQPLAIGRSTAWTSEVEVPYRSGRLFPELRSFTTTNGSGSPSQVMQVYGEGGELNAGDVQL